MGEFATTIVIYIHENGSLGNIFSALIYIVQLV